MPSLSKTKTRSKLSHLKFSQGTDQVVIGTKPQEKHPNEKKCSSLLDARKVVSETKYLLKNWIPFGMLTGLIAEPGIGKSAFALYGLVRPVVTGCNWFDGSKGPGKPGYVLLCPTEHDLGITLSRVKDWSIPEERILLPFSDVLTSIDLNDEEHLEAIEQRINEYKIKLVVIDSLRGSHKQDENNSKVVDVVTNISNIAERTGAAIVIVHHTRKLMLDEEISANACRGNGAIMSMMRSMIGVDHPNPKSKWCRMQVLKENLGIAPKAIGYLITDTGLEFGEAPKRVFRQSEIDRAVEWLTSKMSVGKLYNASKLAEEAEASGYNIHNLRKAVAKLGVEAKPVHKNGKVDHWTWTLP